MGKFTGSIKIGAPRARRLAAGALGAVSETLQSGSYQPMVR